MTVAVSNGANLQGHKVQPSQSLSYATCALCREVSQDRQQAQELARRPLKYLSYTIDEMHPERNIFRQLLKYEYDAPPTGRVRRIRCLARLWDSGQRAHLSILTLQSSSRGSSTSSRAFRARCAASARLSRCAGFLPGDVVRPSALVTCVDRMTPR